MDKISLNASSSRDSKIKSVTGKNNITEVFKELERGVLAALETYSNVHRGSGHNSMVTTYLYEQAREIVVEYLGLPKNKYVVIFCSPRRADLLKLQLKNGSYQIVSSNDFGLPFGIRALVVSNKALPKGTPVEAGGGTARLVSPGWVIWADAPDKFEAGTPAIINIIAFARALQLVKHFGKDTFKNTKVEKLTATEILYNDTLNEFSGRQLLDELRKTFIGHGIVIPTLEGARPYINLDNAASTPTFLPIWNTVYQTWQQSCEVRNKIIQEVKSIIAQTLGSPLTDYEVIFTSNTTEAINLVAESFSRESGKEQKVVNTLLEHNSNDLPWRNIPHSSVIRLKIDKEGFLDLNELETLLHEYNQNAQNGKKLIRLVAVSGASNVLGVFNNLAEISKIVHKYGAYLLVDAAQMVAHRKVEIEQCGIDYFAFSAHKVYAPFGSGVLVVRKELLNINSAELELIRLSGEENQGGIAALGKALLLLRRIGFDLIQQEEQALTRKALLELSKIERVRLYGIKDPESPSFIQKGGVIVFELKGTMSNRVANALAELGGIGVRYGCHCAHMLIKHLVNVGPLLAQFQGLMAILLPRLKFPGLARVSFGIENTEKDVDTLIHVLSKIAHQPRISAQTAVKQQINNFVLSTAQRVYTQI